MEDNKFDLTKTDVNAIKRNDFNYINNKGVSLYGAKIYSYAVEYYRLAAAMGDINAISNLGYCYLYGRDIEANTSLAIAYFEIAANRNSIDACYKLGDIYGSDKWGVKDREMSVYYYRLAASYLINDDWEDFNIAYTYSLNNYPSLCFALGRELMPEGNMATNINQAYQFLKHAETGYERELENGYDFYQKSYDSVLEYLNDSIFENIKKEYENEMNYKPDFE